MLRSSHLSGFVNKRQGGIFPSTLTVWARYKASDMLSVGDGNAVGTWTDKSGNGRDMTQATVARKPLLRTAASGLFGNTVAIEFLGNSTDPHNMAIPSMAALTQGAIFVFWKNDTDTNEANTTLNVRRQWIIGTSDDDYYKYTNNSVGSGIYEGFGSSARKTTGDPATGALSAWHGYSVTSASGAFFNYINNVQHFTTATNTVAFSATPIFGGNTIKTTPPPNVANKKVAEVIICSAVPTSAERTQIQQYWQDEYVN